MLPGRRGRGPGGLVTVARLGLDRAKGCNMTQEQDKPLETTRFREHRTPRIWKENHAVRSYEVDPQGRLSMISVCNYLQNAASRHAHELGVALEHLLPGRHTWVLSRLKLKMESWPQWRDNIQIYTWPSGVQRLFALRDFRLTQGEDTAFCSAISGWLVIDAETRKPMRVKPFVDKISNVTFDRALPDKLNKLSPLDRHEYAQGLRVRRRDLDVNRHVNNVSYVEWLIESIPEEVASAGVMTGLEINFMQEAFLGETVISRCRPMNKNRTEFFHDVIREKDGRELVRARTFWRPENARSLMA